MRTSNLIYPPLIIGTLLLIAMPYIDEKPHNHTTKEVKIEDHPKLQTNIVLCNDSLQVTKDTQKHIPYE